MAFEFITVVYLLIVLAIGAAIGYFVYSLLDKNKNEEQKDLETFKNEIENKFTPLIANLQKEIASYHTKSDQDRGSLNQVLKDIRTIGNGCLYRYNTFKNVLVSGRS